MSANTVNEAEKSALPHLERMIKDPNWNKIFANPTGPQIGRLLPLEFIVFAVGKGYLPLSYDPYEAKNEIESLRQRLIERANEERRDATENK